MSATTVYFVVQGRGPFPDDMLRHDRCVPATSMDKAQMADERRARRVVLVTEGCRNITDARWDSFGWSVVARDSDRFVAEDRAIERMGPIDNYR